MLGSLILLLFCTGWAAGVSSLTIAECKNTDLNPGLLCEFGDGYGADCFENYNWCLDDWEYISLCIDDLGEKFWTNDTELCRDSLFWINKTCDTFYNGRRTALGQRCSGEVQHCIYPWYLSYKLPKYIYNDNYKQDSKELIVQTSFGCKGTSQLFSHI